MALCVHNVCGIAQRLLVDGGSLTQCVNSCRDVPALEEDDCGLCFELCSGYGHFQTCTCSGIDLLSYM